MKVLQVNCVYGVGSTGKITADLHRELEKAGMESVVCYGRGAVVNAPHVYKTCGELYSKANNALTRLTGLMYGSCGYSTRKLISVIQKEQPDIVHLQCINGYFVNIFRLVEWLKQQHIKTVVSLHGEFLYTGSCGVAQDCERWMTGCGNCPRLRQETGSLLRDGTAESWRRMKAAFDGFEQDAIVTAVSPWVMERAKASPILSKFRHRVVMNGTDISVFHPYAAEALRQQHGLTNEKVVLHVTTDFSADPNGFKGGWALLQVAERLREQPIHFFVAGRVTDDVVPPPNVTLLGRLENQTQLAQYYSMADATLLASKRETFSMVTAESLCCGTPVVGFRAGGPESIALPEHSVFVEQGDIDALACAVRATLSAPKDTERIAVQAAARYSAEMMYQSYFDVYRELLGS